MANTTKCIKSIFYIIKTPEIAKFQEQIWELIEDETNKEKADKNHKSDKTKTKQPITTQIIPGTDAIQEGHYDEYSDQYPEETKNDIDDNDDDNISTTTNATYYSPY